MFHIHGYNSRHCKHLMCIAWILSQIVMYLCCSCSAKKTKIEKNYLKKNKKRRRKNQKNQKKNKKEKKGKKKKMKKK